MRYGNIDCPDIIDTTCEVVYDSGELTATATSITISGLSGDLDKEYRLLCRFIGSGAVGDYKLTFNTDTAANYGHQEINGVNATAAAVRNTSIAYLGIGNTGTTAYQSFSDTVIYAKSGKVRTALSKYAYDITGTTVTGIVQRGYSWNNTVDNITQMVITPAANLIGIGSRIILLKKRELTSGTKTGEIDPQGTTYGHWQLIYDNTLTAAKTNLMLTSQMDSYTKLLIHADGADASTAFYDFSNSAHAITTVGTAQVDTAQSKFGGGSLLLDGNSDYLTVPDHADFAFGTGDFTIDGWVRTTTISDGGGGGMVYTKRANSAVVKNIIIRRLNAALTVHIDSTGSWDIADTKAIGTMAIDTWYHFAVVRSGNNFYTFFNGVQGSTWTSALSVSVDTNSLIIGADNGTNYWNGWLDEFRISKGIARWTANFTPPTRAYNELDGDRDCVYRLVTRVVGGYTGGNTGIGWGFNQDMTAGIYGAQWLASWDTVVNAQRTVNTLLNLNFAGYSTLGVLGFADSLIYAKSGFVRPVIQLMTEPISGTTVTGMSIPGMVWNNATDKIKNIFLSDYTVGRVSFGIGTHVSLWRLNL